MPEIPRDPRQLARDILSGKVKIEDLARERQRQAGGVQGIPQARVPDKIPLPRPVQQPQQRPVVRPPVARVPNPGRSMPTALPRQGPRQTARPVSVPNIERRPVAAPSPVVQQPSAYDDPTLAASATSIADAGAKVVRDRASLRKLIRSRTSLRQGVVLSELLGKPLSLRD